MHKSKIIALVSALIFIVVFAGGCGDNGSVIARVNGEKILQSQLDDKVAQIKLGLTSQGYTFGDDKEQDKELLEQIEEEAKNQLIEETLIMQLAKKEGVSVKDSAVQEQLQQIKQQYGTEVFNQLLQQQQLTEEKLANLIKVDLTKTALFNKVTKDIKVDEKTAEATYEKNPAKYEQLKVAHILIGVDSNASDDQVKAAKKKAQALIAKLDAGEDFAALAKSNSEDTQSGANGGVIDYYFSRDDTSLVKEFVDGAFSVAGEGKYTKEPVQTEYGFHIIKVLDKKDTYEELKALLQKQLLSKAKNNAFNEYFDKAKSEAKIEKMQ